MGLQIYFGPTTILQGFPMPQQNLYGGGVMNLCQYFNFMKFMMHVSRVCSVFYRTYRKESTSNRNTSYHHVNCPLTVLLMSSKCSLISLHVFSKHKAMDSQKTVSFKGSAVYSGPLSDAGYRRRSHQWQVGLTMLIPTFRQLWISRQSRHTIRKQII